jgi:hypothetical protein
MRTEFYDPDDEQQLALATADWDGAQVTITTEDAERRDKLAHAFRRSPVVVDDQSYRQFGTSGPAVLQPGDLEWFRAVARTRVPAETGLAARFVATRVVGGYDPAANYRPFEEQVERLNARAVDR